MSSGERFAFAAYAVVLATVLVYVVIIALKVSRLERDLADVSERAGARTAAEAREREQVPVG